MMIYLDNAATTLPKPVSVERAVCRAMQSMASPGRGAHPPAMRAAETLFQRSGGWCKPQQTVPECRSGAGGKNAKASRTAPRQLRQCFGCTGTQ